MIRRAVDKSDLLTQACDFLFVIHLQAFVLFYACCIPDLTYKFCICGYLFPFHSKGYISQTMKLGALGIPTYKSFSLEELEAATNYFETSSLMGESDHGQVDCYLIYNSSLICFLDCASLVSVPQIVNASAILVTLD